MKRSLAVLLCGCLLGFLGAGCGSGGPPAPLALEQIPAAINKAFATAKPEHKELADRAVSALQGKETGKALLVIQGLCGVPELTKEQRAVATRAVLALNEELRAAAARGDKDAAEFLRMRQANK
jgi:hypothetical protein